MKGILLVGAGGFAGSALRYCISLWVAQALPQLRWPLGTWCINLTGCLLIGALAGMGERFHFPGADARLLLITGLVGGYTTFSAFGLETFHLIRQGSLLLAALYTLSSVVLGVVAVWLGFALIRWISV